MSGDKIYIGNLPPRCDERDVEDFLRGFGRIRDIRLMSKFAFVVFDDPRDAKDAVYDLHGKSMLGSRMVVEFAKSDGPRDRGARDDDRRGPRPLRYERPRHTGYRAFVDGLPSSANWQDLKDLARTVGKVTFADCHRPREGQGEVEFEYPEDLDDFVRKVDGTELKGSVLSVKRDPDARPVESSRDGYGPPRGLSRSPAGRYGGPPASAGPGRDYRDDAYDRRSPPRGGRGGRSPSPARRSGGYDDQRAGRSRSPVGAVRDGNADIDGDVQMPRAGDDVPPRDNSDYDDGGRRDDDA